MIVELIVGLIVELIEFLGGLFGTLDMPGWWSQVDSGITYLTSSASSFANWIPLAPAVNAIGFIGVVLLLALTIKVVRIVASFFTAGGGSAA